MCVSAFQPAAAAATAKRRGKRAATNLANEK
jgi:hypothetical protein